MNTTITITINLQDGQPPVVNCNQVAASQPPVPVAEVTSKKTKKVTTNIYDKEQVKSAILRCISPTGTISQRITTSIKSQFPGIDMRCLSGFLKALVFAGKIQQISTGKNGTAVYALR